MSATRIGAGQLTSHPSVSDSAAPSAANAIRTVRRPRISERCPIVDEATAPTMCMAAIMYEAPAAASITAAPASERLAARNAGAHAHMPSSSAECPVYPAIKRRAAGFFQSVAALLLIFERS